ncbi:MAG: hypothetical protein ABJ004_08880 [Cyclobacteriaceae bacterium]
MRISTLFALAFAAAVFMEAHAVGVVVSEPDNTNRYKVEKRVLALSARINAEMMALAEYKNLKVFCNDDTYRETIFVLLEQIHWYHDILEDDLQSTKYNHSQRVIKRILKHLEKLEKKYNPAFFEDFFEDQCRFQSQIEENSTHYRAAFGTHSYGSRVYAQEVSMYRYLKTLTRRVERVKHHVEHFYIMRQVWEH